VLSVTVTNASTTGDCYGNATSYIGATVLSHSSGAHSTNTAIV